MTLPPPDGADLQALRKRLEDEEAAYAAALAAVDALAAFALPLERLPDLPRQIERLNALWDPPAEPPPARGLRGRLRGLARAALQPVVARQREFNSYVVQILNGQVDETARLHGTLRELAGALVRFLQRLLPTIDARDRVAGGLVAARCELILESFDRRQESLAVRLQGLAALRDSLEALGEEVHAVRAALAAGAPEPEVAAAAARAARDAGYAAFENRFRGSREEIRERLSSYLELFQGQTPVLDLGCGRGEFLGLLGERGLPARGVDGNADFVRACREQGLRVDRGDLVDFLRAQPPGSAGGVFAAQVAEHLPPAVLQEMLREAHRVLRPGGLLVLETPNPRSVVGLLEVFHRDLTHERPLHPETLSFLAAGAGFMDIRVEMRSPVDAASRLQPVPADGLPPRVAEALNENVARLNAIVFGPQEYALVARR